MNQGQLFGVSNLDGVQHYSPARPLARTEDPGTSRAAAAQVAPTLNDRQRFALDAIRRHPGRTVSELEEIVGCRSRVIGRRTAELEVKGLIRRGEDRRCRVTGYRADTWHPVDDAGPAIKEAADR